MKYTSAILLLLLSVTAFISADDWQLIWSDEFTEGGLPDKTKWDYEEGFVRNKELQYYTRDRLENARVENGHLIIEGIKEQFPNEGYVENSDNWRTKDKQASYTAASLITKNKAWWQYGRIEIKAKLPRGKGVWPAIWMMGANRQTGTRWPDCGEIDIMEYVGKDPHRIHANIHFKKDGKHTSDGGKITHNQPYDNFHIYAIEWYPDRIDFYFDDSKYHTFTLNKAGYGRNNPFRKPHYLLINLALGGAWGGEMDDSVLPQKYEIDYVRVYERNKEIIAMEKYPSDPKRFEKAIAKFEASDAEAAPEPGGILCIGSSSMKGWHRTIAEDLAPLSVIPRGFGGSTMNDVLHFTDRIVLPYKPRAIVLYEGDNDVSAGVSPGKILETFRTFTEKVWAELPECRIYILAVKPSIKRWQIWPGMQAVNKRFLKECSENPLLTYIDIAGPMLNEDGNPKPDIFQNDKLHMNRNGYILWRDAVRPVIMPIEEKHETK